MNTAWLEISCTVPVEMADDLALFLVELTGNGVSIDNRVVDTFSLETIDEPTLTTVAAYLDTDSGIEAAVAALTAYLQAHTPAGSGFIPLPPVVTAVHEEDWANSWKAHFRTTRIGRRLVLKPTWETVTPEAGDIIVELDPGMAFGTGTHPTTRLCLEFLEAICCSDPPFPRLDPACRPAVLDVGTGSGILGIAAAKFGATEVTAIDIDPRAVIVAEENIRMNGVGSIMNVATTPLQDVSGTYRIVLANILAEELVRLSPELVARMAPDGYLILSGILTEREDYVRKGFSAYPVTLAASRTEAEWCCLCYRKEP
jgi:ribosomal protein L11 methyltransferase